MSEHTKKLVIIQLLRRTEIGFVDMVGLFTPVHTMKEMEELVSRWNAFEEHGLVPKLLAIKQISYEAICTGDQEASDKAIGLIEDLDAKIAEAEKT